MKASDLRLRPISQRILARTVPDGDCRIFQGSPINSGYGVISWSNERWLVHRAIWTDLCGPIPPGMTIDHLCRKKLCVVVEHMEVVTQRVNNERAGGLEKTWTNRRAKTHCKHGHEFTPDNTEITEDGHRGCRTCRRAAWHLWYTRSGRRKGRKPPSPCGTRSAYIAHRKRGEEPCSPCRAANTAYAAAQRTKHVDD